MARTKLADHFNFRGRRFTKAFKGGLSHSLATEKLALRRRLAPEFIWAIHQEKDGTWSVGRAAR